MKHNTSKYGQSRDGFSCLTPSKFQENLLECGLVDRVVLDRLELGLDGLHAAEQRGPGGGRVADMEVNVVQVLVSDHTGVKLLDHTGLQFVQK